MKISSVKKSLKKSHKRMFYNKNSKAVKQKLLKKDPFTIIASNFVPEQLIRTSSETGLYRKNAEQGGHHSHFSYHTIKTKYKPSNV